MENTEPSLKPKQNSSHFLKSVLLSIAVSIITIVSVVVAIKSYTNQSALKAVMEGKSYSGIYLAVLFAAVGLYVLFNKVKPRLAALTGIVSMVALGVGVIIFTKSCENSEFKNSFLPDSTVVVNSTENADSKIRDSYWVSISNKSELKINEIEFTVRYSINDNIFHQVESIQSISLPPKSTKMVKIEAEDLSKISLPDSAEYEIVISCVNTSVGNCRLKSRLK